MGKFSVKEHSEQTSNIDATGDTMNDVPPEGRHKK